MKRSQFVLTLLVLWLPTSPCRGEDNETGKLEGSWLPVEAELSGQKFPDEVLKTMKLILERDTYTVYAGEQIDRGTIQLASTAEPKAMDITGTEGPNKGKTFLAIYELAGDTLRICYDLAGKQRPTEFKTAKGSQQFLVRYEREKE